MRVLPRASTLFLALAILLVFESPLRAQAQDPNSSGGAEADTVQRDVPRVEPVTVTIMRTPRTLETLTGSADVVDRASLDLRSARTVEEAVGELPGLNVVGSARYGQEVRLNTRGVTSGFGTQRTLVLLDGRSLTDEYLGTVDLVLYPLDAISRVELIRGPASALYGTNAMGGVVNLIPRRGSPVPLTELAGQGGTFRTWNGAVSHGRMVGPVDTFVSLYGSATDGYLKNVQKDKVDWETQGAFSNVGYDGKAFGLRFYGGFFHGSGTDEDFDRDVNRDFQDLGLRFRARRPDTETRLRLYRSGLHQTLDWFSRPSSGFDQRSLGAILTQTHRPLPAHLVTAGAEWRLDDAVVDELAGTVDRDVTTWAGFVQDEFQVSEALGLVLGLRFDSQGETTALSYRTGLNYRMAQGTILRASVGRAFRAPTLSDRFLPPTSFFGAIFEGNPELNPEVLVSADAGVSWQMAGGIRAEVTGFATWAQDFYDFLLQPDGVFRPENIARVNIHGVEAQFLKYLGRGFEAAASYTYTDAYYNRFVGNPAAEGNRLDDNVLHQGTARVTYRTTPGFAGHLAVYVNGNRFTDPENTVEGLLSPYYLVNLAFWFPLGDKLAATLQVDNLTDKTYRTRPEFPQPGRTVTGGFRILF